MIDGAPTMAATVPAVLVRKSRRVVRRVLLREAGGRLRRNAGVELRLLG